MTAGADRRQEADRDDALPGHGCGEHSVAPVEMTPDQRTRLQQLLETELRAALRTAAEAGARPGDLAASVAERRRALEDLLVDEVMPALLDDVEHASDQPPRGKTVGEQG